MSLKDEVARVLESSSITGNIRFVMASTCIVPADFARTGEAIRTGKIAVVYSAGKKDEAEYDASINTFQLHNEDTLSRKSRGLIVHEAVHSIHDRLGQQIRKLDDECAAYLAQGMYLVRAGVKSGQAFKINKPLYAGMTVAEQLRDAKDIVVSNEQMKFLQGYVQADKKYSGNYSTIMTGYAGL